MAKKLKFETYIKIWYYNKLEKRNKTDNTEQHRTTQNNTGQHRTNTKQHRTTQNNTKQKQNNGYVSKQD